MKRHSPMTQTIQHQPAGKGYTAGIDFATAEFRQHDDLWSTPSAATRSEHRASSAREQSYGQLSLNGQNKPYTGQLPAVTASLQGGQYTPLSLSLANHDVQGAFLGHLTAATGSGCQVGYPAIGHTSGMEPIHSFPARAMNVYSNSGSSSLSNGRGMLDGELELLRSQSIPSAQLRFAAIDRNHDERNVLDHMKKKFYQDSWPTAALNQLEQVNDSNALREDWRMQMTPQNAYVRALQDRAEFSLSPTPFKEYEGGGTHSLDTGPSPFQITSRIGIGYAQPTNQYGYPVFASHHGLDMHAQPIHQHTGYGFDQPADRPPENVFHPPVAFQATTLGSVQYMQNGLANAQGYTPLLTYEQALANTLGNTNIPEPSWGHFQFGGSGPPSYHTRRY
jgi:hypothetical protein